jgi:hypothetical protein
MLVAGSAIFSPRDGAPHKTEENARAFLKTARAAISQTRH